MKRGPGRPPKNRPPAVAAGVGTRVNPTDGVWLAVGWLPDGSGIVAIGESERDPEDLWVLPVPAPDASGAAAGQAVRPRRLTRSLPAAVPVRGFVEPERLTITARDGLAIPVLLWRPPAATGKRGGRQVPTVVHAHGGPTWQAYRDFQPFRQLLAQEGFAFLSVDFRGSTGYGREFRWANRDEWGHADVHDVVDAARWAAAQPWSNGKLAMYGGSYGGYLTLCALVEEPGIWAAGVDLYGDSEIAESYRHGDRAGRIDLERMMGRPDDPAKADLFRRGSPLYRAERIEAPLLILHGRKDKRVVPLMTEKIVEALEIEGKHHEVHWYDDEGHGWERRENRRDAFNRILGWLRRYVLEEVRAGGLTAGRRPPMTLELAARLAVLLACAVAAGALYVRLARSRPGTPDDASTPRPVPGAVSATLGAFVVVAGGAALTGIGLGADDRAGLALLRAAGIVLLAAAGLLAVVPLPRRAGSARRPSSGSSGSGPAWRSWRHSCFSSRRSRSCSWPCGWTIARAPDAAPGRRAGPPGRSGDHRAVRPGPTGLPAGPRFATIGAGPPDAVPGGSACASRCRSGPASRCPRRPPPQASTASPRAASRRTPPPLPSSACSRPSSSECGACCSATRASSSPRSGTGRSCRSGSWCSAGAGCCRRPSSRSRSSCRSPSSRPATSSGTRSSPGATPSASSRRSTSDSAATSSSPTASRPPTSTRPTRQRSPPSRSATRSASWAR